MRLYAYGIRWYFFQQFDFKLEYVKGKDKTVADSLSSYRITEMIDSEPSQIEVNLICEPRELEILFTKFLFKFKTAYDK